MVPISGSAYTYAYATLGELVAWIIGWDLIIEYAVGNVAVAISWSGYFYELLRGVGIMIPGWLATDLRTGLATPEIVAAAPHIAACPDHLQPPGRGDRAADHLGAGARHEGVARASTPSWWSSSSWSSRFSSSSGFNYVKPENWTPFTPNGLARASGPARRSSSSPTSASTRSPRPRRRRSNPQRDMPLGIIGSLVICTVIYIAGRAACSPAWCPGIDARHGRAAGARRSTATGLGVGGRDRRVRRGLRAHRGAARLPARPAAHLLLDGARRPAAAVVRPRCTRSYRTPHVTTILTGVFVAVVRRRSPTSTRWSSSPTSARCSPSCWSRVGLIVLRRTDPERAAAVPDAARAVAADPRGRGRASS